MIPAGAVVDGAYRIEAVLGQGGMGVVYRARDLERDAPVALKVLLDADPAALARFLREGEVAARVDRLGGPARVHRSGHHAGLPYVVMELVPGRDLAAFARESPSPDAIAQVIESLARTLHACHLQGVVHRDVKPSNVLVQPDGQVRILDFGIARDARATTRLTATGELLGTPSYMAPEQVTGAPVDARSDVYGIGATLHHALSGRAPFEGPLTTVLNAVLGRDPPPVAGAPPALDAIRRRAMAKDPALRYPDALALAVDLASFRAGAPLSGELAAWRRLGHGLRLRQPRALALLGGVVVGVAVAGAGTGAIVVRSARGSAAAAAHEVARELDGRACAPGACAGGSHALVAWAYGLGEGSPEPAAVEAARRELEARLGDLDPATYVAAEAAVQRLALHENLLAGRAPATREGAAAAALRAFAGLSASATPVGPAEVAVIASQLARLGLPDAEAARIIDLAWARRLERAAARPDVARAQLALAAALARRVEAREALEPALRSALASWLPAVRGAALALALDRSDPGPLRDLDRAVSAPALGPARAELEAAVARSKALALEVLDARAAAARLLRAPEPAAIAAQVAELAALVRAGAPAPDAERALLFAVREGVLGLLIAPGGGRRDPRTAHTLAIDHHLTLVEPDLGTSPALAALVEELALGLGFVAEPGWLEAEAALGALRAGQQYRQSWAAHLLQRLPAPRLDELLLLRPGSTAVLGARLQQRPDGEPREGAREGWARAAAFLDAPRRDVSEIGWSALAAEVVNAGRDLVRFTDEPDRAAIASRAVAAARRAREGMTGPERHSDWNHIEDLYAAEAEVRLLVNGAADAILVLDLGRAALERDLPDQTGFRSAYARLHMTVGAIVTEHADADVLRDLEARVRGAMHEDDLSMAHVLPSLCARLGHIFLRQGRLDDAEALVAPQLDVNAAHGDFMAVAARIAWARGDLPEARRRLQLGLARSPRNAPCRSLQSDMESGGKP